MTNPGDLMKDPRGNNRFSPYLRRAYGQTLSMSESFASSARNSPLAHARMNTANCSRDIRAPAKSICLVSSAFGLYETIAGSDPEPIADRIIWTLSSTFLVAPTLMLHETTLANGCAPIGTVLPKLSVIVHEPLSCSVYVGVTWGWACDMGYPSCRQPSGLSPLVLRPRLKIILFYTDLGLLSSIIIMPYTLSIVSRLVVFLIKVIAFVVR